MKATTAICLLLFIACTITHHVHANIELPTIGGPSAGTEKEEQRIGSAWLKLYRQQVSTSTDDIIIHYVEQLLSKLVVYSDLPSQALSLVVVDNPAINAFAVPGGVIGIHTGLINAAESEQQFASVLAHELAHLSQRHYARGVEAQKGQRLTTMAALLASLILVASGDGDGGAAALTATQGLAIDQQLRFSRGFEQEADRLGMETLARAGMNPHAAAEMFEHMDRASRFSSKPPEFLLTHPLTSNRMADALNLSRRYPKKTLPQNIDYHFVRARTTLLKEDTPQQAIKRFQNELTGVSVSPTATAYGLALAYINNKQFDDAELSLAPVIKKHPKHPLVMIAHSDITAGKGDITSAISMIQQAVQKQPTNYPLQMQLSRLLTRGQQFSSATEWLNRLSAQRETDPIVWYHLAEASGLSNDITLLHKARAEYFILYGNFDNAEQQLKELLKKAGSQDPLYTYATQRLNELDSLRKAAKL